MKANYNFIKQLSARLMRFKDINAMACVKAGRPLVRVVLCTFPILRLRSTKALVRAVTVFLKSLSLMFKHQGAKGACLRLKVYAVLLQQSLGGYVVHDITGLKFRVSRTNRGLPRIIPRIHREMIRDGNVLIIRLYLTIFNLYRLIYFAGDFRLSSLSKTIVTPAVITNKYLRLQGELVGFIPQFLTLLQTLTGLDRVGRSSRLRDLYNGTKASPIGTSSPFTSVIRAACDLSPVQFKEASLATPCVSTHPLAVVWAAWRLAEDPVLSHRIEYFLSLLPLEHPIRKTYLLCRSQHCAVSADHRALGKLSLKEEAAGKVRVFAMVDCWTQWLLKPLHEFIFSDILPFIPQDGTKDQLRPLHHLLNVKTNGLFSLDLSAATDRLPLWLQKELMAGLVDSVEFADA
jgi:hypothetical protein